MVKSHKFDVSYLNMKKKQYNQPLFFVFTCIKDGSEYIGRLFDCMLSQTKVNFVHYIYEDGSTKPLGKLIDQYKEDVSKLPKPYEVVYEYNLTNIGLNKSTQHCINKCNCPYFIWIDCDNYVDSSFFEELEKLYRRNKNSLLLRSIIYNSDNKNEISKCNCGTLKEAKTKYQIGLFLRRKFYYSFFAVNYEKYKAINPNNVMLDIRSFYNDEQVLILCLLNCSYAPISTSAKGYFTTRDGQESSTFSPSIDDIRTNQLKLCQLISNKLTNRLSAFYSIKDLYDELFINYKYNYKKSLDIINKIKKVSKENQVSLKNYYDYNLVKHRMRVYYYGAKRKWKK